MFTPKQLNPFCTLVLILTALFLSNCYDKSEYGEASDYEKLGYGPSGSGIIKGAVSDNASVALSGVSVTYAKSGTTSSVVTTVDNGTYSKSSLSSGTYTLTYSKSGYLETSQSATLTTDNETLEVAKVKQLSDTCASGTISGRIKDAVSDSGVLDVSLSVRNGLNTTSGTIIKTATTDSSGDYSLSSMSAGWYTAETSKDGYINASFSVYACGNQANQGTSISTNIDSGTMRIILHWGAASGLNVVDSHLTGPDNSTGRFHIYWDTTWEFYYATNAYTCGPCTESQIADNVSLDNDDDDGQPGTETITIPSGSWRSGTYRYSAHDYTNRNSDSTTKFSTSGTTVKVYYNGTESIYTVPTGAGNLWTVFTIDGSSKVLTTVNSMSYQDTSTSIQ